MKVLVTGGGGFLGKRVVELLVERGDAVRSVARGAYPELDALGVEAVRGDLADAATARRAVEGVEAVIHTAGKVGMWGRAEDFERGNVLATQNLIDAAQAAGVRWFVFTGSPSCTFDGGDTEDGKQDLPYPTTFLAHYPRTKAAAEQLALRADNPSGMRVCSLRPHLIWGPGDPHLIPRLLARARAGRLKIVGDGKNKVDLTYIDNAAIAHLQALDALGRDGAPGGKAYFISDAAPVVLWDWVNDLFGRVGVKPVTAKVPLGLARMVGGVLEGVWGGLGLSGEPPMTRFVAAQLATSHWYDMGPARRDLGYAPRVKNEEGMALLVEDLKRRGLA
jgi:nucleoside-diphosphate-sugar epimerase